MKNYYLIRFISNPLLFFMTSMIFLGCSKEEMPQGKFFSGEPVDHWLETIRSPDPIKRKKAAVVLGNVGDVDPRSIPALIKAVKDEEPSVRDAAVLGLSKIGPTAISAEIVLTEATKDEEPVIREHSINALKRVKGLSQ